MARRKRRRPFTAAHLDRVNDALLNVLLEEAARVGRDPVRQSKPIAHVETALHQNGVQRLGILRRCRANRKLIRDYFHLTLQPTASVSVTGGSSPISSASIASRR